MNSLPPLPPIMVSPPPLAIVSLPPLPPWIVSPGPPKIVSVPPLDASLIQINDTTFVNNNWFSVFLPTVSEFAGSLYETTGTLNYTNRGFMFGSLLRLRRFGYQAPPAWWHHQCQSAPTLDNLQ